MKCYNDPKRDAVGICTRCGKAVCPEEAVIIDDKLYCKKCAEKIKGSETHPKHLRKSSQNRMLGGICGGLGEYFDIDATFVRIIFVVLLFVPGIRFWFIPLVYLLLWIIMPEG